MTEQNREQMMCRLSPAYENSMQNPEKAEEIYPGAGNWYAVIQAEASGIAENLMIGQKDMAQAREKLLEKAGQIVEKEENSADELRQLWKTFLLETATVREMDFVKSMVCIGEENPYETVLEKADNSTADWMEEYGLPVTETDKKMMRFWFGLEKEKLQAMGKTIADAFLHGFISQSRDRRERKRVRFYYQIGQEALAREVIKALKEKGLTPVITAPHTLHALNQWQADHQFDHSVVMDEELFQAEWKAYETAMYFYEKELKDTCGMIGIDQFGMESVIYTHGEHALQPDEGSKNWKTKLEQKKRDLESQWIRPSEISFCKVAFPNLLVGERFEEIFEDFFQMNVEESEPFEKLQQVLIDGLDTCDIAEIKGCNGNETDIRISLWPIKDPTKETKFLNCGGDLNIPYGEVFTTPKLAGTTGLYHVEEICLKGIFYHDLRLTFQDGWVVDANCREGKEYVMNRLLYPNEKITMGEFAVGSNTKAYAIAHKYQLGDRLPILIYEKMGPHIAIGDPCFARSEDASIYNMYDHKEMVCRENEITAERNTKENIYFGNHVDITLPYHQVKYLRGIRKDGTIVSFIENGRFVLKGTEGLNIGFGGGE